MAKQHSAESEDHGIDLAPMLDFTINLLIFFIITTSFIKEPGIEVFKPVASSAEERPKGDLLVAVPSGEAARLRPRRGRLPGEGTRRDPDGARQGREAHRG